MSEYQKQANDFLAKFGITFEAVRAVPQTCPEWSKCEPYKFYPVAGKNTCDARMAQYPHHTFVNSDPENYCPDFSHRNCDLCDALPGDRYNVTAVIIGFPHKSCDDTTQYHFEVCADCMYYVAYGEGPDDYMSDDDTDLTTFNGRLHNASDVDDKCDGYKSIGG